MIPSNIRCVEDLGALVAWDILRRKKRGEAWQRQRRVLKEFDDDAQQHEPFQQQQQPHQVAEQRSPLGYWNFYKLQYEP
jgi:hypothetical protein